MTSPIPTQQAPKPVSEVTLLAWRRENQRLLHNVDDDIHGQPTTIELGLRLLREFKNVQDDLQMKSILADALYGENPTENYITAIEQLADQAVANDYYGLQEACLLIAEALQPVKEGGTLDDWSILIRGYLQEPSTVSVKKIIAMLHNPVLHLRISEDEFAILETLLTVGLNVKQPVTTHVLETQVAIAPKNTVQSLISDSHSIADYIVSIEQIAKQAATANYQGLQSICLLLIEVLHELVKESSSTTSSELVAQLEKWSSLVETYENGSESAVTELVNILHHPDLELFLSDDELTMLEQLLIDDIKHNVHIESTQTTAEPTPSAQQMLDECLTAIEQSADQAAQHGYYPLQDACLLLVEAVRQLPDDSVFSQSQELSILLTDWLMLVDSYSQQPYWVTEAMMKTLRHPELNCPLTEDEFTSLETQLAEGVMTESMKEKVVNSPTLPDISLVDYIEAIEQQADSLAADHHYALQDGGLLLVETLRELPTEQFATSDLPALLQQWLTLVEAYKTTAQTAIPSLLAILRSTALALPLTNDEFIVLENGLMSESGISIDATHESSIEPPSTSDIASTPTENRDDYIQRLEQLADRVAMEGYYALQDASLLLIEALAALSLEEFARKPQLISMINQWSEASDIYSIIPHVAIPTLLNILHSADLQVPLADDEFILLETALNEGSGIVNESTATSLNDTDATDLDIPLSARLESALDMTFATKEVSDTSDSVNETQATEDVTTSTITVADFDDKTVNESLVSESVANDTDATDLETPLSARLESALDMTFAAKEVSDTSDFTDTTIDNNSVIVDETVNEPPVSESIADTENKTPTALPENHPLSKAALELVELLMLETEMVNSHLVGIQLDDAKTVSNGLEETQEELERYSNAALMAGFDGLAQVCRHVANNVQSFRANDALTFNVDKLSLLQQWLEHVKHYLTTFAQADAGCALVAHLQNADWALPWSSEDSAACLAQMQSSGTSVANLADQTRKQSATSDDVSLIIPSDVNKELLDILLQELPTYTQQFSESLQRLQTGGSAQDVEIAQRVAHTIKGSANTVGVKGIAVLTHHLEDILLVCAKEHKLPKGALMNSLITASDCLETMTESLLGMSDAPSEARAVLQEILDWANQIDQHGIPDAADIVAPTAISHDNVEDATSVKPETAENTETAPTAQVSMVRVPTEQIENLFRLSSESIILNGQIFERHRRIKNQIQAMEAQFILLQQLGSELDQLIDLKDLSGRSFVQSGKDFDALEMDQYNELHTASRRMVEAAVDAREISIDVKKELELMSGVLDYQQRLVIDTQESIMQTRLVPVASITPRLQRGLRQTCRLTGKQCDLVLAGEQLLIDGDTLNALVDPLMHVLRNAIDHGIENEEERLASGKPQTGKISINFDREGNSILVRVCDDGKGLDYDAIRATAEKRGALQAGQIVSEDELKRFILQPNFSTRTVSTQTSGRGVGMDAVRFQVINLGGVLTLHSEKGKGLTVDLLIPLPLSRSHALLANVCQHKVAITSKGLVQIVYSGADELTMTDNHRTLVMGDDVYPVVKLEDLLHITDHRKDHRPHNAVLMVQTEDKITAVLVSSISDSRDVVIKSLGYYLGKIQGFIGATILGDGSVIPVLDIPELLRSPTKSGQSSNALFNFNNINEATDAQTDQPSVLVVDDSLSQRRALEQILQDAGYKVYIARDGIEAVEFLSHTKVNVVLTDLEMPRMNGIELASHIRTQARTKDLPIIMITSRTTQKHRQMSEDAGVNFYLVKPVQDDDLLTKIYGLINMSVHEVSA